MAAKASWHISPYVYDLCSRSAGLILRVTSVSVCYVSTKWDVVVIGNESVPKITINDSTKKFFLRLQSAFW